MTHNISALNTIPFIVCGRNPFIKNEKFIVHLGREILKPFSTSHVINRGRCLKVEAVGMF
jgi:hypothetical protein